MVTIRLTRRGGKKEPFYHVVVTDSRKRQGGTVSSRWVLQPGRARQGSEASQLDLARIDYWTGRARSRPSACRSSSRALPQGQAPRPERPQAALRAIR